MGVCSRIVACNWVVPWQIAWHAPGGGERRAVSWANGNDGVTAILRHIACLTSGYSCGRITTCEVHPQSGDDYDADSLHNCCWHPPSVCSSASNLQCTRQAEFLAFGPVITPPDRRLSDPASSAAANQLHQAARQRYSNSGATEQTRRRLLAPKPTKRPVTPTQRPVTPTKPPGTQHLPHFKYLANGTLAPGQKRYPVECSSPASSASQC